MKNYKGLYILTGGDGMEKKGKEFAGRLGVHFVSTNQKVDLGFGNCMNISIRL